MIEFDFRICHLFFHSCGKDTTKFNIMLKLKYILLKFWWNGEPFLILTFVGLSYYGSPTLLCF